MKNKPVRILRKEKFKEYFVPAIVGGFVIGLIFLIISLAQYSMVESLQNGLAAWMGIIFLYIFVGFFSEEWYLRKRKLKKLNSAKYRSLFELGLTLNDELEFVGEVNNYNVRFYLYEKYLKPKKYIDQHYVDIYCLPKSFDNFREVIDNIKNISGIDNAAWGFGIFSMVYSEKAENLKLPIEIALKQLSDNFIMPLSRSGWENTFEKEMNKRKKIEERKRTKQVLKTGKFDIRYVKNKHTNT